MSQLDAASVDLPATPLTAGAMEHDAHRETRIVRHVMLRLIPFMILLYLLNYIDRVNISAAKKMMGEDLGLSDQVYGWGVGIFFVGYFLFEVPSNLIMEKVGPRRWMARIMVSWG